MRDDEVSEPTLEEAFLAGWKAGQAGISIFDCVRYDVVLGLDHVMMARALRLAEESPCAPSST